MDSPRTLGNLRFSLMTLPNLLTLVRIPLMLAVAALLHLDLGAGPVVGAASLAFVLYVIAGLTDWLDGYVARRRGEVSKFGILMDALVDKIFMLGVLIVLVGLHKAPVGFVLLILCREFLITGMRLLAASKGVVLAAEKAGKQKTVTQILAVGAILLELVAERDLAPFAPEAGHVVQLVCGYAGLGLLALATFLTVNSGALYLRKYRALVFEEASPRP